MAWASPGSACLVPYRQGANQCTIPALRVFAIPFAGGYETRIGRVCLGLRPRILIFLVSRACARETKKTQGSRAVPSDDAVTPPAPPSQSERGEDAQGRISLSGSGYVITAGGDVITNAHVVEGCRSVTVSVESDRVTARVLARDPVNDLALLASDLKPKSVAVLRTGVRLGESVAVFGFPLHGLLATSGNFYPWQCNGCCRHR
jgi:S1-C subfamily serine protease